jgi:hypothetical protein
MKMLDAVRSGHGLFVTELFEHLISGMGMLVCQTFNWLGGQVTVYICLRWSCHCTQKFSFSLHQRTSSSQCNIKPMLPSAQHCLLIMLMQNWNVYITRMCRWVKILMLKVICTTLLILTNKQLQTERCVNRMTIGPVRVLATAGLYVVHTCTTYTSCCTYMYHIHFMLYIHVPHTLNYLHVQGKNWNGRNCWTVLWLGLTSSAKHSHKIHWDTIRVVHNEMKRFFLR